MRGKETGMGGRMGQDEEGEWMAVVVKGRIRFWRERYWLMENEEERGG